MRALWLRTSAPPRQAGWGRWRILAAARRDRLAFLAYKDQGPMPMSATDPPADELLSRARAGDDDARGRLLEAYRSYLTLLARVQMGRSLQGKVDPSDLLQEAFLEEHRAFLQFRN